MTDWTEQRSVASTALPPSPLLAATGIAKRFGGLQALGGVDFRVDAGEIVGLVGPNGSGKSTLLACLSRDLPLDDGVITFGGEDITGMRPMHVARRGLGRTFQNIRLFPELTVWENTLLGRQWADVGLRRLLRPADSEAADRSRALLELIGLTHLAGEYAGNLSGGQKRLVELAMAMASRPRLVMLDEATSGVNATLIESLKNHVRLLNAKENVAFLIVEHNIDFIFSLADRIVVLQDGVVLAEGTPEQIQRNPEVIDAYLGA